MKKCFKCGEEKERSEFYTHPRMADGLLGKCKDCTKLDSKTRHHEKLKDPEWVEAELLRHRIKAQKARDSGKKSSVEAVKASQVRWNSRNRHKKRAHVKVKRAIERGAVSKKPCEKCGNQMSESHHEDYSKPLEVQWLCKKHHGERHVEINRMRRQMKLTQ